MAYIILVALLVLVVVAIASPFGGLLGLVAINVIQPGELYPLFGSLRVERVMAILVLLSFLFHNQFRIKFPPLTRNILALWGAMFISVPFSVWRLGALNESLDFGKIVIYHVLIVNLVTSVQRLRKFLITFALLIGWLAGSSFYEYQVGGASFAQGIDRAVGITSSGGDPNNLGATLVSAFPILALVIASRGLGIWRWISLAIAAVSVMTTIITGSRAAFFSFLILLGASVLWSRKRVWLVPAAALLLLGIWALMPAEYRTRYRTVASLERDASYQNRVIAWRAGWHMFLDHPITGIGAGQFAVATGTKYWPAVFGTDRIWLQAHSLYFQLIGELGLLGTFAFAAFLIRIFRTNYSLAVKLKTAPDTAPWIRYLPAACCFSLLTLLVSGYSGHNLYRNTWYVLAGLTASLTLILAEESGLPTEAGELAERRVSIPEGSSETGAVSNRERIRR